jgi:DNA polymerase V
MPDVDSALAAPQAMPSLAAPPRASGFAQPTQDYAADQLSLDALIVSQWQATFFMRAGGDHPGLGVRQNDLLVVDRSLAPQNGRVIIAVLDGELLLGRIQQGADGVLLQRGVHGVPELLVDEERQLDVWGTVTWVLHRM